MVLNTTYMPMASRFLSSALVSSLSSNCLLDMFPFNVSKTSQTQHMPQGSQRLCFPSLNQRFTSVLRLNTMHHHINQKLWSQLWHLSSSSPHHQVWVALYLLNISQISFLLSISTSTSLTPASTIFQLDYCSSLLIGLPASIFFPSVCSPQSKGNF